MRIQFGKDILESDVCVICGVHKATTREHIPPQALFIEKPRENLVVPCCEECNNSTKLEDEYLRQTMSAISLVGQGRKVWTQKVVPKFKYFPKTQAGLRKAISTKKIDVESLGKVNFPVIEIDSERLTKSIQKMVYGLHWFHSGRLLSPEAKLSINLLDTLHGPKYLQDPAVLAITRQTKLGIYQDPKVMNTFFYTGVIYQDTSIWFFSFFKQGLVVATATSGN